MDKNTLSGVLLMTAIVFGFMYLNRPSQEEIQQRQEAARQDSIARVLEREQSLRIPEITADDVNTLRGAMAQFGVLNSDSTRTITTDSYELRLSNDTVIEGVIKTPQGEVDVNNVIAGLYPTDWNQENKAAAGRTIGKAIADLANYRSLTQFRSGEDTVIKLKNNVLSVDISTKGAQISSAVLSEYKSYLNGDTTEMKIWGKEDNMFFFTLYSDSQKFRTDAFYFTPEVENDSTVLMKLELGADSWFGIRYSMPDPNGYYVEMDVVQHNIATANVISESASAMDLCWWQNMPRLEVGEVMEQRNSALYYKPDGEDVEHLSEMDNDGEIVDMPLKWIGFKNQFFSSILIANDSFNAKADLNSAEIKGSKEFIKRMKAEASVNYSVNKSDVASFTFYLGPNLYPVLSKMDNVNPDGGDLKLTEVIPLGWSLFRWINTGVIIPVFTFLSKHIANYGIIILILTLLIKLVLFPFTYKTYRSQAKMKVLGPEIKEINDKYPGNDNAMIRQQKTMELYSKAGVSPMGGCLPMLLQMPILVAMFSFFPSCIELRGQSFLWATDLSAPDTVSWLSWDANIPVISWLFDNHISIFCLLMTVTNIIYSKIMMQSQPGGATMPGMKLMTYGMPLMFLFWFNNYAAGLSYYYFLSLLITIIQTYVIRHWVIDENKVRAEMAENAKKPRKKNGWLARMEEAQRKQQALMREQAKQQNKRRR